jgi:hypothetical protein
MAAQPSLLGPHLTEGRLKQYERSGVGDDSVVAASVTLGAGLTPSARARTDFTIGLSRGALSVTRFLKFNPNCTPSYGGFRLVRVAGHTDDRPCDSFMTSLALYPSPPSRAAFASRNAGRDSIMRRVYFVPQREARSETSEVWFGLERYAESR